MLWRLAWPGASCRGSSSSWRAIVEASEALGLTLGRPDPRTPYPPDEWIRRFGTLPLMYQPGERWLYNAGSLVLGVLVGRAAGRPLEDLLHERVFEPLGMTETGFHTDPEKIERIPPHYLTDLETGKLTPQTGSRPEIWAAPPAFPSGAGGLMSTVDDFLKFARLLLAGGGGLLSPESVRLMTTSRLTREQIETGGMLLDPKVWGYGLGVAPDGRYGWEGGYGTVWFNDPGRGVIAMAMTQCSDFLFNGARDEFVSLI